MLQTAPTSVAPRQGRPRRARHALLVALLLVYLVLLVWLVMWKLHEPFIGRDDMRGIKLVPFVASGGFGPSSAWEVLGNVAVFVPFGAYLGALAPRWSIARVAAVAAALSLAFEVAQYVTAVGSSDVTDVIANAAGALLGVAAFRALRRRLSPGGRAVLAAFALAATVGALVLLAILVAGRPVP